MSGFTNRGKFFIPNVLFRGATRPSNYYLALVTDAVAPGPDTNTFSQLTEIADGNGYATGGFQLSLNSTDFDVLTEDDAADAAFTQLKDIVFTASGGPIPDSGDGASFAVLLDDNATVGSRIVIHWWEITNGPLQVSDGQAITLPNLEMRFEEPAP